MVQETLIPNLLPFSHAGAKVVGLWAVGAGALHHAQHRRDPVALGGTGHVLSDPTVVSIAATHNVSAARVALRWVIQQGVVAVTSTDKTSHLTDDLKVFDFKLTGDEMDRLAAVV